MERKGKGTGQEIGSGSINLEPVQGDNGRAARGQTNGPEMDVKISCSRLALAWSQQQNVFIELSAKLNNYFFSAL